MKKRKKETKIKSIFQANKNILLFLIITFFILIYIYFIRLLTDDELFNYGFANNILNGLIPYKDFNMIIPPFFHYLLAIILKIFGQKLIVYHIVLSIMISGITILAYKKIGRIAFPIGLILLTYPYTGYNIFCVLLLFILISKKEDKYSKYIDPILIIMMILSKQTLALLAIPNLIYSKNKKKTFLIYVISALIFLAYLLINNNLIEFIDYCFLGMFDFADKNNTGLNPFLFLEIGIILVLAIFYKKEKNKNVLYVLMFQIMAFPIVNYYHFVISFAPALYILFSKIKKYDLAVHFTLTIFISFFIFYNIGVFIMKGNYEFASLYPVEDSFMKGRITYTLTKNYVKTAKEYLDEFSNYTPYIFGYFAYTIKLNNNIPINKFDIINNGNMGYGGEEKYIAEIEEHCKKNKCIFIVSENELNMEERTQTNKAILKYAMKNYTKIYSSSIFGIYTN